MDLFFGIQTRSALWNLGGEEAASNVSLDKRNDLAYNRRFA